MYGRRHAAFFHLDSNIFINCYARICRTTHTRPRPCIQNVYAIYQAGAPCNLPLNEYINIYIKCICVILHLYSAFTYTQMTVFFWFVAREKVSHLACLQQLQMQFILLALVLQSSIKQIHIIYKIDLNAQTTAKHTNKTHNIYKHTNTQT